MTKKETTMKLKVDLECEKCHKKVKKLLCKYPQIRDQKFDEKGNSVTITVVCCSPEKIRDKLCCKGGGCIKNIEIVESHKPKPAETEKKEKEVDNSKTADPEKKKGTAETEKKKETDKANPGPPPVAIQVGLCFVPPCHDGRPCYGYGGPVLCYHGCYARPVYDCYGGGMPCYVSRCDQYFSEENATGCTIM